MNDDYKALKELQNTINTIKELEEHFEALMQKKAKIAATTVDYKHNHFPFAKAVKDLEEKAKSKSIGTSLFQVLITVLFSALIAGIFTGVYYFLYMQNTLPASLLDYHRYIIIGLPLLFFILIYLLSHHKIHTFLTEHRKKNIINKNKETLQVAKEKSIEEAESYQRELNTRIKSINQEIKTTETNIKGHQTKLEKHSLLPQKYYHVLDDILTYFEDKRADTLKEAINLYVKEKQDTFRYTRLLYAIKDQNIPVEVLLDEKADLETYKTLPIKEPQTPKSTNPSTVIDDTDNALDEVPKTTTMNEDTKDTNDTQKAPSSADEPTTKQPQKPTKKSETLTVYTKD